MKNINIAIPDDLKKALEDYSKESGIIIKKIVEVALTDLLKNVGHFKNEHWKSITSYINTCWLDEGCGC